jgi:hypothetical protein
VALTTAGETAARGGLNTSLPIFVALAALPVLAAAALVLSTDVLLSREMTWDLLFNLAGAWHLLKGHIPHLDFHEPVGALNFLLTRIGFALVGCTPFAFVAGAILVALAMFVSATAAAIVRLTFLPALLFVAFVSLLVLMPANIGDKPNAYSFAMSYNRYGWSALSILTLIFFLPRRDAAQRYALDVANAAALLAALFYLKITYFTAALGLLAVACFLCPHMRARLPAWLLVGGVLVANALAPWNGPYLSDILRAADAGAVRNSISFHLNNLLADVEGYAAYAALLGVAGWLYLRRLAPLSLPLGMAAVLGMGVLVLSQNAQSHGLPLGIAAAFLLYGHVHERWGASVPALPALALLVLGSIGADAFSLVGYYAQAKPNERVKVVTTSQLAGLAVPAERAGLLTAFASDPPNPSLLNAARREQSRYELSPAEYVTTLQEAAGLLQSARYAPGKIALLDQVNPLPFMLGWTPPRGGNLWSGPGAPVQPAEQLFADVDYVLIPKFSTYMAWTERAEREYGPYLAQAFPVRQETRSWVVLSRQGAGTPFEHRPQSPPIVDLSIATRPNP